MGQVWLCICVISGVGRLKQEDCHNFEASLGYSLSTKPPQSNAVRLGLKNKSQKTMICFEKDYKDFIKMDMSHEHQALFRIILGSTWGVGKRLGVGWVLVLPGQWKLNSTLGVCVWGGVGGGGTSGPSLGAEQRHSWAAEGKWRTLLPHDLLPYSPLVCLIYSWSHSNEIPLEAQQKPTSLAGV